jgi:hydrogenase maturation protease
MNLKLIEEIADAVLYEGYILYPYRASSVKNRKRWNFGVLSPPGSEDACCQQTEVLVLGHPQATLTANVRFLQVMERSEGETSETWQEAVKREILVTAELGSAPLRRSFHFPAEVDVAAFVVRKRETLDGAIEIEGEQVRDGAFRIRIRILNLGTPEKETREQSLMRSMVSAHIILSVSVGEFVSLIDPPKEVWETAANCRNVGTWPVLVGEEGLRDAMLSSPIILYDYPQIALESPGALFDGTEIDEILTLRIMAMTDAEKSEMRQVDERARQILERTEALPPEQLMKLHGALRALRRDTEAAK